MRCAYAVGVSVVVAGLAASTQLVLGGATQARVISVGIIGFRDDSGANVPAEILRKIAGGLQQELNRVFKETLLARALEADGDRTVEGLGALGRQSGVTFVIRGGLLSLSATSIELYADVIAVETGRVTTIRAEGESQDSQTAISTAIQRLSVSLNDLVVSASSTSSPSAGPPALAPTEPAPGTADMDEELWQLMSQAEALLANQSAVSTQALDAVRQALEALNAALQAKSSLLADGKDLSEADRTIAARQQELQSAMAAATEQAAAAQPVPDQETGSQKKGVLTSLGEALAQATEVLQQMQDVRAAWNGALADQSAETDATTGDHGLYEESFEEVNGAVTEEGEPVEGVTVTDPESGETATTDANGSYVLRVVPGKLSRLVLTRNGKRLSTAQVHVSRGRPAVADFELKPHGPASNRALRILPSTVVVGSGATRSGSAGRMEGVVRDGQGRPVPRALVSLRGVAVARTDSQGRYAFIGVPAGAHQMTIYRPGLQAQSSQVEIVAHRTSESNVKLAPHDPSVRPQPGPVIRSSGTGTALQGVVVGKGRQPLAGAKVTLLRQLAAVSVQTSTTGSYAFREIAPGEYRVVVSKFGYQTESDSLELRAGKTETRRFTLEPVTTATGGLLPTIPVRPAPAGSVPQSAAEKPPAGVKKPAGPVVVRRPAPGSVRGQVLDAKTGRPLAGAAVSIAGARDLLTNQSGVFVLGNVPPGVYQVVVKRNGYADGRASLTVRAGETASVNVRLTPRPAMRRR